MIKYVTKGGNFISSRPKEELLLQQKSRKNHTTLAGEQILAAGKITSEIIQEHPRLLVSGNLEKIR